MTLKALTFLQMLLRFRQAIEQNERALSSLTSTNLLHFSYKRVPSIKRIFTRPHTHANAHRHIHTGTNFEREKKSIKISQIDISRGRGTDDPSSVDKTSTTVLFVTEALLLWTPWLTYFQKPLFFCVCECDSAAVCRSSRLYHFQNRDKIIARWRHGSTWNARDIGSQILQRHRVHGKSLTNDNDTIST